MARALLVQLCLRFSAPQLSVVGARLDHYGLAAMPHAGRVRRGGFRVGIASAADGGVDADALIWLTESGAEVPEGITTVIDVIEPRRATLRTPEGLTTIAVECLSRAQAEEIARECADQADDAAEVPDAVALHDLAQAGTPHGLPAALGRSARDVVVVDIVDDGPHAIVTGTTGTGKSELLVSWVTAIAEANGPDRVMFVLADFKGGTAFEPLRDLPQVAAVITDLDEEGARRGVSSLTAELRRRESQLAAAGVRDIREAEMPRLVIVVDEFAALLQEHPDLGAVFTDVAARGRALGMHLILGTQRATGVVRDALAANCPLRISLRVSDAADSRLVIGTDAAAELPGGPLSRGLGLVRRPEDHLPVAMRVALTTVSDLRRIGVRWAESPVPRSPWLPALPARLLLADLDAEAVASPAVTADTIVLGRADDPERQSQPLSTLECGADRGLAVLGAPGSGRSGALRTMAVQQSAARWVPADPEAAWDVVAAWAMGVERMPRLVLCDDLDALLAAFPPEHAQQFAQRWEQILRAGAGTSIVLSATRAAGPVGRLLDALPHRALLRMSSRMEHIAAGGEPAGFIRDRPPGRARMDDREVQFAWVDPADVSRVLPCPPPATATPWNPTGTTAVVTAGAASAVTRLREAYPRCEVVLVGSDQGRADPTGRHRADTGRPCVFVGDAETWQRSFSLWQGVRGDGEILVRAEQPADLRQLLGVRELPPYALSHAGRLWSVRDGASPQRAIIPAPGPG